jgi:hypothetical protein
LDLRSFIILVTLSSATVPRLNWLVVLFICLRKWVYITCCIYFFVVYLYRIAATLSNLFFSFLFVVKNKVKKTFRQLGLSVNSRVHSGSIENKKSKIKIA